ncbi:DUF2345 domain-containing protein, partial [Brenneria sp. g21c3]|nr:DUF2345 domain-containing protein [Brenneria sp. g21c3]
GEGNPDRPYIAYALHDSRHPDHVTQANNKRNVIRTPANNKLRMEDERGKEHIKLSTEYGGKSQLNLGHLVDGSRQRRGEGFELRTDQWGAIRAGKGLFISAEKRERASSAQLDMKEAIAQLEQALHQAESLRAAAETAQAELADVERQKALLTETLDALKQQAIVLSAPEGIAQVTPKNLQISAGENVTVTSGGSTDMSVLKKFTVAAGERISLYAQKAGMKLFAARGKVELQAQGDEMALDALKDVQIRSSEGRIIISAKKEIILSSGGGYLRIGNGEVESGAPDKIIQRAAVWQKFSGQSASQMFNQYQQGDYELQPQMAWVGSGEPVAGQQVALHGESGNSTLTTAASGETDKQNLLYVDSVKAILKNKEKDV